MKKQKVVAVVNDNLLMVGRGRLTCSTEEAFVEFSEALSSRITERIIRDPRFVTAVGEQVAKKAHFEVLPICYECEACRELQYVMRVVMRVGNKETDFLYDYRLVANPLVDDVEHAPLVLYNNDGKSQLMLVFESECCGVTSVKTLKNGCGKDGTDDYVERIFAEILSETDLRVY